MTFPGFIVYLIGFALVFAMVYLIPKSSRHGIPKPLSRPLKAHELIKGRVYTDPVAKVRVRVTKVAIEGSSCALENTARGVYWNTATQCYQSMEIADDQLEEYVTSAEPASPTGPPSSTPDN